MKRLALLYIFGLAILVLPVTKAIAQSTVSADARAVLDKNPQLRKVQDFPNIQFYPNVDQTRDGVTNGLYIQNCSLGPVRHMNVEPNNKPKCLVVVFRGSPHSYESGYDKIRTFEAVLAPNSSKVTRVYETHLMPPANTHNSVRGTQWGRLMAEFDVSGHVVSGPGAIFSSANAQPTTALGTVMGEQPSQSNPSAPQSPADTLFDNIKKVIPIPNLPKF